MESDRSVGYNWQDVTRMIMSDQGSAGLVSLDQRVCWPLSAFVPLVGVNVPSIHLHVVVGSVSSPSTSLSFMRPARSNLI